LFQRKDQGERNAAIESGKREWNERTSMNREARVKVRKKERIC
jgi:hypothetical protein